MTYDNVINIDTLTSFHITHRGVNSQHMKRSEDSNVHVSLQNKDLWQKFHTVGTEMIITKAGRWENTNMLQKDVISLINIQRCLPYLSTTY